MNPENSNNEELTRYLLGEMPDEEQTEFEMRYFGDAQLFGQLCAWRNNLIDRYVSNQLSLSMRQRFEAGIDKSWAINERIRFAETLQGEIDTRAVGLVSPPRPRYGRTRESLSKFVASYGRLILVTAALLALLGIGWLLIRTRHQNKPEATETGLESSSSASADTAANAPNQPGSNLTGAPTPAQTQAGDKSTILTVPLSSDLSGNEVDVTTDILIPPNTMIVKLVLIIERPPDADYSAIVTTSKDVEIFRSDHLKSDESDTGRSVNLFVPANRLSDGDYVVHLTGVTLSNETTSAGNYHLRVRKS